jgi:hypothetical protein
MKKILAAVVFVFIAMDCAFGQALLNTSRYLSVFSIKKTEDIADNDYVWEASDKELLQFGNLDGTVMVDTPLEFAWISYCSQAVLNIRPVKADEMLPADNPRLAGLKLGEATYRNLVILKFLDPGDTKRIGEHEGKIKFAYDTYGVSRAEIEKFHRDGIRGLIAEIVNEEFNEISFFIENIINQQANSYGGVLTRNPQNGQYTLSYERPSIPNSRKELSAVSLDALSSAMSGSGDFSAAAINTVKAQAKLIPAVAYPASTLEDVVNMITAFHLNIGQSSFSPLGVKYRTFQLSEGDKGRAAADALYQTVRAFNPVLADRMISR